MKSLLPNPLERILGKASATGLPGVASGASVGRPQPSSMKSIGPRALGVLGAKSRTRKSIIGKNRGGALI